MFDEKKFIITSFESNFEALKKEPVVIYGLGKNTKVILENCRDYNIAGLMDGIRTGETVWGYPVLSEEEIRSAGVKYLVILATAANVPIIYRRIRKFCTENGIEVFDINGTVLGTKRKEYRLPARYSEMTEDKLMRLIDNHEVISFDIFDTLLVRETLLPADIFEIMDQTYRDILPEKVSFVKERIAAERELYLSTNPTIEEIYQALAGRTEITEELALFLMREEIAAEQQTLKPRLSMLKIVRYAVDRGRTVCCTSDMYLPADVLRKILKKAGYPVFDSIFVSCNYRVSKNSGLFEILREKYHGKRILHVGDNEVSDGYMAKEYGIDAAFLISSIYQMAQDSAMQEALHVDDTLTGRNFSGAFFSWQFNDPFLFARTKGKGRIPSEYELGYFFLEPILRLFTEWLVSQCEKREIDCVLLASRDGWIIKKLLDLRGKYKPCSFEYRYFLASRSACTLAGLESMEDVQYAASLAFDGNMEQMLEKRFQLEKSQIGKQKPDETDKAYLERYYELILKNAKKYKSGYKVYLDRLKIKGNRVGIFDFVSSGTCQFWLEKIMKIKLHGLYFIHSLDPYKESLKIFSMYEPKCVYEKQSKMYDNYMVMENVMTSPAPTLSRIDENGEPCFERDTRTEADIRKMELIHQGILDAFEMHTKNKTPAVSRALAETVVDFVRREYCQREFDYFDKNNLQDGFCNRTFDLKKLLEGKPDD
ncbi:MAG: hypothetical protein LUH21_26765 [Clostridiales bacterium]|nr:hypothetical protein [Clostridiales bacterium]